MNAPGCQSPLEWDVLLAYWLGELDRDSEARTEEHFLGCAACSRRLEQLTGLARDVRALKQQNAVSVIITDQFVQRLTDNGLQVREYRVPRNGSVNCSVAPEDDFVVARLEAPLEEVQRVDMVYLDSDGKDAVRQEDIPFIADSGGVLFSTRIDAVRALPATVLRLRLVAVDNHGERALGEYTFNHTPHASQRPE